MATQLTGTGVLAVAGVVAAGGLAYWVYVNRKEIAEAVNPLSDKNLASRSADSLTQYLTGDKTQTFGGWLYDVFNPDPLATPWKPTSVPIVPQSTQDMIHNVYGGQTPPSSGDLNSVFTSPPPQQNLNTIFGLGFVSAVDPVTQRMVLVPKMTPALWTTIAGVSLLLYLNKQNKRRRRRR